MSATGPSIHRDEHVREDDDRFHQLMEQAADALFVAEASGKLVEVNRQACASIGLSRGEILERSIYDIGPDLTEQQAARLLGIVDREGQLTVEGRIRRADGSTFPVEMRLSRIRLNGALHILGAARDITDRKRAEDALRASEASLRSVFENLVDIFYRVDKDGKMEMVTPSVERWGYTPDAIIGTDDVDYYYDPADRERLLRDLLAHGSISDLEVTMKRADGSPVAASASARIRYDERGRALGTEGLLRDATERKRAREELERSRSQLQALSNRLLAVQEQERRRIAREVHDELGQALTALALDVSWLASHLEGDAAAQQKIGKMAGIIDSTMASVQRISRELRPLLLDDLGLVPALDWLVREFQERTGISCTLDVTGRLALAKERQTAIFRVVQEALTNVTRHAGATRVRIELRRLPRGRVALAVEDDGRGIRPDELTRQDSFGLLGMHERIRMCDGTLTIEGSAACGTRLHAVIPVRRTTEQEGTAT